MYGMARGRLSQLWSWLVWVSLSWLAGAVAVAMELRVGTINAKNGVGAPGSAKYEALRETLARLQLDVIAFQEVEAQNRNPAHADYFADLKQLLRELGFATSREHVALEGDAFAAEPYMAGDFGPTTQCVALASRYPITRTVQIGRGAPDGRKEATRYPLFVQLDVPGTRQDPVLVIIHFKQGATQADAFRRALEGWRVRQFLEREGLSGTTHHVLVLGDMNEQVSRPQPTSFTTSGITGGHRFPDGSTLPVTFQLGADVPEVLPYAGFPASAFAPLDLELVAARQTDGVEERTYHVTGQARLDYILVGRYTQQAGEVRAEVYHSGREAVGDGLPKEPSLPRPELSAVASDHLPVWLEMALEPRPALTLDLPGTPVGLNYEPVTVSGTLRLSEPTVEPFHVSIAPYREAPVRPLPALTVPAGETAVRFTLEVAGSPYTRRRVITLRATAGGWREGVGFLPVQASGAMGEVIISQYTEAPSGTSPKSIEVMNVSGRTLVFSMEPLRVLAYTNGSSTPVQEALVEQGVLPPGAVLVIGDVMTGNYLREQGLLPVTESALASAASKTVFTDDGTPQGRAVFVKDSFTFNGNDALELQLNFARADVFGRPGVNPGDAWKSSRPRPLSTANQNLTRRAEALMASEGWDDPSEFFEEQPGGPLAGFGVAPVLSDPYEAWAAALGLSGALADPWAVQEDGVPQVFRFVFDGWPGLTWRTDEAQGGWWLRLEAPARTALGRFRWGVEVSDDLVWWRPVWESRSLPQPTAGPTPWEKQFAAPGPAWARLFVTRP